MFHPRKQIRFILGGRAAMTMESEGAPVSDVDTVDESAMKLPINSKCEHIPISDDDFIDLNNELAIECPAGHGLQAWIARAGTCNGCGEDVQSGTVVMDCRQCNWYLCPMCHQRDLIESPTTWDVLVSLPNAQDVEGIAHDLKTLVGVVSQDIQQLGNDMKIFVSTATQDVHDLPTLVSTAAQNVTSSLQSLVKAAQEDVQGMASQLQQMVSQQCQQPDFARSTTGFTQSSSVHKKQDVPWRDQVPSKAKVSSGGA